MWRSYNFWKGAMAAAAVATVAALQMVSGGEDGPAFHIEIKIPGGQCGNRGCFGADAGEDFLRFITDSGVARDGGQAAMAQAGGFGLHRGEVTLHVGGNAV